MDGKKFPAPPWAGKCLIFGPANPFIAFEPGHLALGKVFDFFLESARHFLAGDFVLEVSRLPEMLRITLQAGNVTVFQAEFFQTLKR